MPYTFWYSGILIGDSDLERSMCNPRQHGGSFRPTPYGLELFPRLTGVLTAGHALKLYLDANGLCPENMDSREIEELVDSTPAGRKMLDIGRTLSDVEMRAPDGTTLEFESIAFTDLLELQTLARELNLDSANELDELPTPSPSDISRYIVSATLREIARDARPELSGVPLGRDN